MKLPDEEIAKSYRPQGSSLALIVISKVRVEPFDVLLVSPFKINYNCISCKLFDVTNQYQADQPRSVYDLKFGFKRIIFELRSNDISFFTNEPHFTEAHESIFFATVTNFNDQFRKLLRLTARSNRRKTES